MKRIALLLLLLLLTVSTSYSQGSNYIKKISFQGILKNADGTIKANNTYNLTFSFFKNTTGGTAVFSESTPVTTVNGFFTHEIGSIIPLVDSMFYSQIYLQIQIQGDPTPISPRVTITPSPYSFYARRAYEAERLIGGGGGGGDGWGLSGNTPGNTDFLGTTNTQPLIMKVKNITRLALGDNGKVSTSGLLANVGFGSMDLQYVSDLTEDTIVAQGSFSFASGAGNRTTGDNSVAMGFKNRSYGENAITMGTGNYAQNEGAIALGKDNFVGSNDKDGLISGIAIGSRNEGISGSILFGSNNTSDHELGITIGKSNIILSSTNNSGVPMAFGAFNVVSGSGSIAIGENLTVLGNNSIAIGTDVDNDAKSSSFIIGTKFLNPQAFNPTQNDNDGQMVMRFEGGYKFYTNDYPNTSQVAGVSLAPNGSSWETLSDRNTKENFTDINFQEVLNKIELLSVTQWNYKNQDNSFKNWGPMAQDFQYYFGLGNTTDSVTISTLEMDGVLISSVKGLIEKTNTSNSKIKELKQSIVELQNQLDILKSENSSLSAQNTTFEKRLQNMESTVINVLQQIENPTTQVRTVTSKK